MGAERIVGEILSVSEIEAGSLRIKRDDVRAVVVWKRGCELDHGLSCTTYAGRLWLGRSVERDLVVAGEIFRKACRLEHAVGCTKLGVWNAKLKGMWENTPIPSNDVTEVYWAE